MYDGEIGYDTDKLKGPNFPFTQALLLELTVLMGMKTTWLNSRPCGLKSVFNHLSLMANLFVHVRSWQY